VVGGFSQGCAISLITGLASRWKGSWRSGWFEWVFAEKWEIKKGRGEYVEDGEMRVFLGHGTKDMLVPVGFFF
jgi:predicted esterase